MRTLRVQFLTPDKKIVWMTIPWGKKHLDWWKERGYVVLMTEQ